MTKQRISDHDASALLLGRTPDERPDLGPIAESVAQFRAAAYVAAPRPSAELLSVISTSSAPREGAASSTSRNSEVSSSQGRVKKNMFASIAGLGLATKLVLGVSVAAVAGVAGASATGVIDEVVPTQQQVEVGDGEEMPAPSPSPSATWNSADYKNFGKWVSLRAHDKDSVEGPFGKMISEAAHQKNAEKAALRNGDDAEETTEEKADKPDHGKQDNPGQGHKPNKGKP